jgi:exodeoxyribonuclease-3
MPSFRIVNYNINGLRAALRKGLLQWLEHVQPDVLCLQEIKIDPQALQETLREHPGLKKLFPHQQWHSAEKKGYSGVALLSKLEPTHVWTGCNHPAYDAEGRMLRARFAAGSQNLDVMSLYLPSGSQGEARQAVKEAFMDYLTQWLPTQPGYNQQLVLTGDFNICHEAIDIHDPVRLKTVSGFLPHERQWLTQLQGLGYTDSFRHLHPHQPDHYTWWTFRGGAKERNKGWRIDYQWVPNPLQGGIVQHQLVRELDFSDHIPGILTLEV